MKSAISGMSSVVLVAGALLSVGVPFSSALASSGSQRECEAAGGTYVKIGSVCTCELPPVTSKPGNDPAGVQGSEKTVTQTDGGQGNLGNKETTSTECVGNKGQCG